jgi:hypothetical protein
MSPTPVFPDAPRRARARLSAPTLTTAIASGLAAGLADCRPTGLLAADILLTMAFGGAVTVAGSYASPLALAGAASIAGVASGEWWAVGLAVTALALALVLEVVPHAPPVLGAVSAGLTAQVLLRLPEVGGSVGSAVVAAVAVGWIALSAFDRSKPAVRRRVVRWAVLAGVVAGVATAGAGLAALDARQATADAVIAARQAFVAARAGDDDAALVAFQRAALAFADAQDAVRQPWAWPARLMPVLGPQLEAVDRLAEHGTELAQVGADATVDADLDRIRFNDGRMDLDAVRDLEAPLLEVAAGLEAANEEIDDADSPWLLPPVDSRVDLFADEIARALPEAELALDGVRLAPQMLGADGPRNYFLAFVTPAELRGLGGFMGQFGVLTADDGELELTRHGSINRLTIEGRAAGATIDRPQDYVDRWGTFEPERFPGDIPFAPDFPTVAQVIRDYYPQTGGTEVDGVISVDPVALQALLTITGPIRVPDLAEPLTDENAAQFLLEDQYLEFGERADRKDFLNDATEIAFETLTAGDIPAPSRLADVLGPAVHQGRLMVAMAEDAEQALIDEVPDLAGEYPAPDGGDFVGVTTQNGANNKIDIFMQRRIEYDVQYDPSSGSVQGTATVEITNEAPSSGLPDIVLGNGRRGQAQELPTGTNEVYLSLYSPHDLLGVSVDGQPIDIAQGQEAGWRAYSQFVLIPPGATRTVVFELQGTIDPEDAYRLTVGNQPVVNPDEFSTTLRVPEGWEAEAGDGVEEVEGGVRFDVVTTDGDATEVVELD